MPSPLSVDPRERVVAAMSGGASCRQAASRFGVSAASAGRWLARLRQDGHVAPKPSGGDHASRRVEAHAGLIPAACRRQPTAFSREVRDHLARRGVRTGTSGLSRFFARRGISREKGRRSLPSRTGRT